MKISIIVPVYNAEKYIDNLIKSILNQSFQDYEVILVDDGSIDKSYELIKKYADENDRIFAYHKENEGPGIARKFGYERSNGDLIYFVDSDDWLTDEQVLYTINDIFSKKNIDILFFDREDLIGNRKLGSIKGFEKIVPGEHLIDEITEVIRPGLGAKILKRQILDMQMFIDSNVYEDLYTTYLYLNKCKNFYYIDKELYTIYHDEDSNSLSSINNESKMIKSMDIMIKLYNIVNSKSLKYSLALRMPTVFIPFYMDVIKKKKYTNNPKFKNLTTNMAQILKENEIKVNKNEYGIIKVIIYNFLVWYLNRKVKNEKN